MKSAVFTISRNEATFLPIWLGYYRQHFSESDIYVLDHNSTDGSTDAIANKVIVSNELTQDNDWLIRVTCNFQKELLKQYEYVLFANADEIIVPDPEVYSGIQDYLAKTKHSIVRCTGFEVLHMMEEAALKPGKVLEQRGFWFKNPAVYNKPLIGKMPIEWTGGWHHLKNAKIEPDPTIFLIHLHRMDYSLCLARHKKTAAEPIFRPDLDEKRWGWHHMVEKNAEFAKWFYCVEAAKVLAAEQSETIYKRYQTRSVDEIYNQAKRTVTSIPQKWKTSV